MVPLLYGVKSEMLWREESERGCSPLPPLSYLPMFLLLIHVPPFVSHRKGCEALMKSGCEVALVWVGKEAVY